MILKKDRSLKWFSGEKSGRKRRKKAIKELEGKVDVMVGVMHMGLENENGILVLVFKILQMLVGTKCYFAAHMHKLVKEVVNGVIIAEPDKYGTHISY